MQVTSPVRPITVQRGVADRLAHPTSVGSGSRALCQEVVDAIEVVRGSVPCYTQGRAPVVALGADSSRPKIGETHALRDPPHPWLDTDRSHVFGPAGPPPARR